MSATLRDAGHEVTGEPAEAGRGELERGDVRPRYVIDDLIQLLPTRQG